MKTLQISIAVLGLLAVTRPAQGAPATVDDLAGKRVMVLGDSITQDGKYVSFIEYYLTKLYPQKEFDIVSIGLGSETTSGLSEPGHPFPRPCVHERLGRALAKVQPRVVIACYGMNDGIYHPPSPARTQAYHDGITKLVQDAQAKGVEKVILLTPPVFDARAFGNRVAKDGDAWSYFHPYFKYEEVLAAYSKWIMGVNRPGVVSIDLHTPMAAALAERCQKDPEFRFAKDGIHPSPLGHLVMAQAVLTGLGVKLPEGDLDTALAAVQADPLFEVVNQRRALRSNNWLPYIGYTRGGQFKRDSIADTEKEAAKLKIKIDTLRGH